MIQSYKEKCFKTKKSVREMKTGLPGLQNFHYYTPEVLRES